MTNGLLEHTRNLYTTWRMYRRNLSGRKFEPETPYMEQLCNPGDTCLHLGASDGRHSYYLSHIVGPVGKIYAFEPSRYSFAIMCRLLMSTAEQNPARRRRKSRPLWRAHETRGRA